MFFKHFFIPLQSFLHISHILLPSIRDLKSAVLVLTRTPPYLEILEHEAPSMMLQLTNVKIILYIPLGFIKETENTAIVTSTCVKIILRPLC
jgi:hypothetical protein